MKGLELSRLFYEQVGAPMLEQSFPDLFSKIAIGLCGSGSECFGYDDELSQDHDFEPGFCIFLPSEKEVDRKTAFQLERAYAKLPKEFMGFSRNNLQPVGGSRHGVLRLEEFLQEKLGSSDGILTQEQWLHLSENALAEMTNGEIFRDDNGYFTAVREVLRSMPEDIRKKKLAGCLLLMAQSGQYNYNRCLKHGETGAAQLATFEFARNTMHVIFLLNHAYMPYYKWSFRAMRELPILGELAETLETILTMENIGSLAETKYDVMESIASMVIEELQNQDLTKAICGDLEKHAYSVNDSIEDADLRNRHILCAVSDAE